MLLFPSEELSTFPRQVHGEVSQQRAIYLHDSKGHNRKVHGPDASGLKWTNVICGYCNTTRTQPHDKAWASLHAELRKRAPNLKPGDRVRGNRVFRHDTAKEMLNVHLYFAKAFGCTLAVENAGLIDIAPFARAIMTGTPHPDFYLNFGILAGPPTVIQASAIRVFPGAAGEIHATWFYNVDGFVVEGRIVLGAAAQKVAARQQAWHPRLGTNCLNLVKIEPAASVAGRR